VSYDTADNTGLFFIRLGVVGFQICEIPRYLERIHTICMNSYYPFRDIDV